MNWVCFFPYMFGVILQCDGDCKLGWTGVWQCHSTRMRIFVYMHSKLLHSRSVVASNMLIDPRFGFVKYRAFNYLFLKYMMTVSVTVVSCIVIHSKSPDKTAYENEVKLLKSNQHYSRFNSRTVRGIILGTILSLLLTINTGTIYDSKKPPP